MFSIIRQQESCKVLHSDSSDSEGLADSSDSDEITVKRNKSSSENKDADQLKTSPSPDVKNIAFEQASSVFQSQLAERFPPKFINKLNVWSTVLQEQGLVEDLHSVGVDKSLQIERDSESYEVKYQLDNDEQEDFPSYSTHGLKRSIRDSHLQQLPILEKSRRDFEVNEDDTEEHVITGLATILRETNVELMGRVVNVLGKKKSIELLRVTEDIEENGGLMTMDNSRRRTPGGVFLYLLRKDPRISRKLKDKIFEEDDGPKRFAKKVAYRKMQKAKAKKKAKAMEVADGGCNTDVELPPLPSLCDVLMKKQEKSGFPENTDKMDDHDSEKEPGEIDSDDSAS